MVGLTQQAVGEITKNTNFGKICNSYEAARITKELNDIVNEERK